MGGGGAAAKKVTRRGGRLNRTEQHSLGRKHCSWRIAFHVPPSVSQHISSGGKLFFTHISAYQSVCVSCHKLYTVPKCIAVGLRKIKSSETAEV